MVLSNWLTEILHLALTEFCGFVCCWWIYCMRFRIKRGIY